MIKGKDSLFGYLSHPAVRVKTMKEWTFDQNNFYSNQIRINEIQMTMFS